MPNRDPQRGRCSHSSSVVKFPFPLRGCFATLSGCFARGTVLLIFKVNSLSPLQYPSRVQVPNRDPQRGRCSHSSSVVKFPCPLRGCFATLSGCFARGTVLLIFKVNSLSPLQYPHLHCTDRSTVQCQGYRCHPALQDKQQGSPKGTLFALFECREIPLPPAGVLRE